MFSRLVVILFLYSSCVTPRKHFEYLDHGTYTVKNDSLFKVTVVNEGDSSFVQSQKQVLVSLNSFLNQHRARTIFRRGSLDVDVFTTPFKYRAARGEVPAQLNTTFNGGFYFGYRRDHYIFHTRSNNANRKFGYGAGGFFGLGSVFINPTFVQNNINFEYDAFALSYGFAVTGGYGRLNSGIALGFDFLTDMNKNFWIYEYKPWIGVVFGISLNE